MLKLKYFNTLKQILIHKNFITIKKNEINKYFNIYILDISYFGKTYKWNIKKNFIKLTFNRVHKTNIYTNKLENIKKINKNKIRLLIVKNTNTFFYNFFFYKTRKYNIFTHRGIKIKNNFFLKKRGKISTYKQCLIFEIYI